MLVSYCSATLAMVSDGPATWRSQTARPHAGPRVSEEQRVSAGTRQSAYIAKLWEQPTLCIGLFGVQFHTEEGQRLYEASGISDELHARHARSEGA